MEAIPWGFRASASTTVHHGIICCGGVSQDFGKVPKCVPTAVGVTTWWCVHLVHILSTRMLSNTIDMFMRRASASTTVHGINWCGGVNQDFGKVPKCVPTAFDVTAWWWLWVHLHIHSTWMLSNTIDMFMYVVDVEAISCGFKASTTAPWNHLLWRCEPGFWQSPIMFANCCWCNNIMVSSSSHTQHMNVLKHIGYVRWWIWKLIQVVLEPLSVHHGIICCGGVP